SATRVGSTSMSLAAASRGGALSTRASCDPKGPLAGFGDGILGAGAEEAAAGAASDGAGAGARMQAEAAKSRALASARALQDSMALEDSTASQPLRPGIEDSRV